MLNFNKKKYVSFDNLSKFSGMIQKALSDKLKNVETNLNEKIDSRFKSLTAKEQGDSEVIDAREGQVSLSENLKTYVKKEEHENLDNKVSNKIIEIKSDIRFNRNEINDISTWMYANKKPIQRVIDFVDAFKCEFQVGNEGYIKLPDVMGGFIMQWGTTSVTASGSTRDAWKDITYPIPFKTRVYHHTATLYSTAWINCGTTGSGLTTLRLWAVGLESGSVLGTEPLYFTWFAIGK